MPETFFFFLIVISVNKSYYIQYKIVPLQSIIDNCTIQVHNTISYLLLDMYTRDKGKVCCKSFVSCIHVKRRVRKEESKNWVFWHSLSNAQWICLHLKVYIVNKFEKLITISNIIDTRARLWKRLIDLLLIKAFFFLVGILEKYIDSSIGSKNLTSWACYLISSMLSQLLIGIWRNYYLRKWKEGLI